MLVVVVVLVIAKVGASGGPTGEASASDPAPALPFVDFGIRCLTSGASFSAQVTGGMTGDRIAVALLNPASPVAQAIEGTANAITAALCQLTGDQPAGVCGTSAAKAPDGKL